MVFKIHTSKKTQEYFEEIANTENLQPFVLSKLAISMSIKSNNPLQDCDFSTDNFGLELNRQTITGEFDSIYKSLIEMFEGKHISDNEYFQKYLKAHLDRGAKLIYQEFKYNKDFLIALLEDTNSI